MGATLPKFHRLGEVAPTAPPPDSRVPDHKPESTPKHVILVNQNTSYPHLSVAINPPAQKPGAWDRAVDKNPLPADSCRPRIVRSRCLVVVVCETLIEQVTCGRAVCVFWFNVPRRNHTRPTTDPAGAEPAGCWCPAEF